MHQLGWQSSQPFCNATIAKKKPANKFKLALDFC
jgi:hypothetical protein